MTGAHPDVVNGRTLCGGMVTMGNEASMHHQETAKARTMTRSIHRRWAAGLLLASLAKGGLASAEEKGATAEKADNLYADGVKAAREGQWETARVALLLAFTQKRDAKTAANLGLVELVAGKPRDAAEHLSFFLREARDINTQDRQVTEELLTKAKTKIGTVTIRVNTQGAEVLVDGQRVGTSPLTRSVFLEPGNRKLEAKKEGFSSSREEVAVAASSAPVVTLKLSPVQTPPLVPAPKPDQAHDAPPNTGTPRWRTWGIVGGAGLAAVGTGIGIGFSIAANAKNVDAQEKKDLLVSKTPIEKPICPNQATDSLCGEMAKHANARDTYRNVAIAGFAAGGVGIAGALFSALWKPSRPGRGAGKEVTFSIVPSIQGVVVRGSF